MHATVCAQHGLILDHDRAAHARLHQRARTKRRADQEPWRFIYNSPAWKRCLRQVLRRDGHRCRIIENGDRCDQTERLEGHHLEPLRQLWASFDRNQFIREATNPATVITVCPRHHRALEAK